MGEREQKMDYGYEYEKKVDGKPVEVKVTWNDTVNGWDSITFYRFERCKEVLRAEKAKEERDGIPKTLILDS